MTATTFIQDGFVIDTTPVMLPDAKFTARAIVTRQDDQQVKELWPDFAPFGTEAEASSAAHLAAVAWVSHRSSEPPDPERHADDH